VRTELVMRIAEVFRDNDVEIAYPTRDVWFRNTLDTAGSSASPQAAPTAEASKPSNRG